jgi:hypothetical protein
MLQPLFSHFSRRFGSISFSNPTLTPYRKGSGLTEYILPALLLGGVILGVLASTNWDILGQNYVAKTNKGQVQNKALIMNQFGKLNPNSLSQEMIQETMETVQVCFDGLPTCLNVRNIKPSSDTDGSLGADTVTGLADILEQLPGILADLNVDPSVVDRVTKLASQGHDLAIKLRAIEAVCARDKTCTGPESREAQKQLRELQAGHLGKFMSEWKTLETYMTDNPNALKTFPEAYGIIKSRVNDINLIVQSLATANLYNQIPSTRQRLVPTVYDKGILRYKNVTETTYSSEFKGLSFQSPNVKKVHQNANSICTQGGNQKRCHLQF